MRVPSTGTRPLPGSHSIGFSVRLMPSEPLVKLLQLRMISRAISENASVTMAK